MSDLASILESLGVPASLGVRASLHRASNTIRVAAARDVPASVGSLLNAGVHEWAASEAPPGARVDVSRVRYRVERPDSEEEDLAEREDADDVLRRKVDVLARLVRGRPAGSQFVVYTGAGLSTAAKIADFRGPNGAWTRRDRGLGPPPSIALEAAVPTFAHRAVAHWLAEGVADYVVSQNIDNLHRRSGVPAALLSELHGNCFLERCASCGHEGMRDFNASRTRGPLFRGVRDEASESGISHITGRACEACDGGMMRDSVVHFGESLPAADLERAEDRSRRAAVALCAGTSLRVTPAADLPGMCAERGGVMVVVNLQRTGRDLDALRSGGFVVHGRCDRVFELLAEGLGVGPDAGGPANTPESAAAYARRFARGAPDVEARRPAAPRPAPAVPAAPAADPSFFGDLGLPPTMRQLPPELAVVQRCEAAGPGRFRWSLCVEAPTGYALEDYVESVTYRLHETFDPSEVTVDAAPFALPARTGWGEFEVRCEVRLLPDFGREPVAIAHRLNFGAPDGAARTSAAVRPLSAPRGLLDRLLVARRSLRPGGVVG